MIRSLEDHELDAIHGGNVDPATALVDPGECEPEYTPPPPPWYPGC